MIRTTRQRTRSRAGTSRFRRIRGDVSSGSGAPFLVTGHRPTFFRALHPGSESSDQNPQFRVDSKTSSGKAPPSSPLAKVGASFGVGDACSENRWHIFMLMGDPEGHDGFYFSISLIKSINSRTPVAGSSFISLSCTLFCEPLWKCLGNVETPFQRGSGKLSCL